MKNLCVLSLDAGGQTPDGCLITGRTQQVIYENETEDREVISMILGFIHCSGEKTSLTINSKIIIIDPEMGPFSLFIIKYP